MWPNPASWLTGLVKTVILKMLHPQFSPFRTRMRFLELVCVCAVKATLLLCGGLASYQTVSQCEKSKKWSQKNRNNYTENQTAKRFFRKNQSGFFFFFQLKAKHSCKENRYGRVYFFYLLVFLYFFRPNTRHTCTFMLRSAVWSIHNNHEIWNITISTWSAAIRRPLETNTGWHLHRVLVLLHACDLSL